MATKETGLTELDPTKIEETKVEETKVEETKVEDRGDDLKSTAKVGETKVEETKAAEKPPGIMIPKARFDQVNTRLKAVSLDSAKRIAELEAELATAKGGQEVSAAVTKLESEVTALETKLDAATESAVRTQLLVEIKAKNREIGRVEADAKAKAEKDKEAAPREATAKATYEQTVSDYEALYPQLDGDSEAYDQDMVDLVMSRAQRHRTEGKDPVTCLQLAVDSLKSKFTPAVVEDKAKELAEQRTKEALDRGKEAKKKQPAVSAASHGKATAKGTDEGVIDTTAMTEKEFAALTDTEKARLRGDFVDTA